MLLRVNSSQILQRDRQQLRRMLRGPAASSSEGSCYPYHCMGSRAIYMGPLHLDLKYKADYLALRMSVSYSVLLLLQICTFVHTWQHSLTPTWQ